MRHAVSQQSFGLLVSSQPALSAPAPKSTPRPAQLSFPAEHRPRRVLCAVKQPPRLPPPPHLGRSLKGEGGQRLAQAGKRQRLRNTTTPHYTPPPSGSSWRRPPPRPVPRRRGAGPPAAGERPTHPSPAAAAALSPAPRPPRYSQSPLEPVLVNMAPAQPRRAPLAEHTQPPIHTHSPPPLLPGPQRPGRPRGTAAGRGRRG